MRRLLCLWLALGAAAPLHALNCVVAAKSTITRAVSVSRIKKSLRLLTERMEKALEAAEKGAGDPKSFSMQLVADHQEFIPATAPLAQPYTFQDSTAIFVVDPKSRVARRFPTLLDQELGTVPIPDSAGRPWQVQTVHRDPTTDELAQIDLQRSRRFWFPARFTVRKKDLQATNAFPAYEHTLVVQMRNGQRKEIKVLVAQEWNAYFMESQLPILQDAISLMPEPLFNSITKIEISPTRDNFLDGNADAAANENRHTYYPRAFEDGSLRDDMAHEIAHTFTHFLWQHYLGPELWDKAMKLDGAFISPYAATRLEEDFAETFSHYVLSLAGTENPELRARFPHRFALLDEIFDNEAKFSVMSDEFARYVREKETAEAYIAAWQQQASRNLRSFGRNLVTITLGSALAAGGLVFGRNQYVVSLAQEEKEEEKKQSEEERLAEQQKAKAPVVQKALDVLRKATAPAVLKD